MATRKSGPLDRLVGASIRQLRVERGFSEAGLAERIGVTLQMPSPSIRSRIERPVESITDRDSEPVVSCADAVDLGRRRTFLSQGWPGTVKPAEFCCRRATRLAASAGRANR